MRKAILMALLALVSVCAMAEWVPVTSTSTFDSYADPSTIRKSGNIVQMVRLTSFKSQEKTVTNVPYFSEKTQSEYDCKEQQSRGLFLSLLSGKMGTGAVILSGPNPNPTWIPVPLNSVSADMFNFACNSR